MDTALQLPVFFVCALLGVVIGILYDAFRPLRFCKVATAIFDVAFFVLAAILYVFAATACRFPDFRIFTYFGIALGFIIYSKSLRIVVAFFMKVCYNRGIKVKNAVVFRLGSKKKAIGKEKKDKIRV